MDVGDYVIVELYFQGTSIFAAPILNITFVTIGTMTTNLQVTTNNIPTGAPGQFHYWIAGTNCDRIYGEYIEPVDGKC